MTDNGFPVVFPTIETARLILREIRQEDSIAIFKNFSDPEIGKWFFEEPLTEMEQVNQFLAEFDRDFAQKKGITWALTLKEGDSCIGTCGYGHVEFGDRGEIGFDLAKDHWGKGLMTEALQAIIDYGFKILNLSKVEAHSYTYNVRAIRLMEKLGFRLHHVEGDTSYLSLNAGPMIQT